MSATAPTWICNSLMQNLTTMMTWNLDSLMQNYDNYDLEFGLSDAVVMTLMTLNQTLSCRRWWPRIWKLWGCRWSRWWAPRTWTPWCRPRWRGCSLLGWSAWSQGSTGRTHAWAYLNEDWLRQIHSNWLMVEAWFDIQINSSLIQILSQHYCWISWTNCCLIFWTRV